MQPALLWHVALLDPDPCCNSLLALQAARKVFNTALSSQPSGLGGSQQHAASLALAFAECELRRGGNEARPRAVHALACLGSGGPFTAFRAPAKGVPISISTMSLISVHTAPHTHCRLQIFPVTQSQLNCHDAMIMLELSLTCTEATRHA